MDLRSKLFQIYYSLFVLFCFQAKNVRDPETMKHKNNVEKEVIHWMDKHKLLFLFISYDQILIRPISILGWERITELA